MAVKQGPHVRTVLNTFNFRGVAKAGIVLIPVACVIASAPTFGISHITTDPDFKSVTGFYLLFLVFSLWFVHSFMDTYQKRNPRVWWYWEDDIFRCKPCNITLEESSRTDVSLGAWKRLPKFNGEITTTEWRRKNFLTIHVSCPKCGQERSQRLSEVQIGDGEYPGEIPSKSHQSSGGP